MLRYSQSGPLEFVTTAGAEGFVDDDLSCSGSRLELLVVCVLP